MNIDISNFTKTYESLRRAKGHFVLFAVFLPDESAGRRWDVVASAKWLKDDLAGYNLIFNQLKRYLTKEELSCISRIAILPHGRAIVNAFLDTTVHKAGSTELYNVTFSGVRLSRAIIIASDQSRRASSRRLVK